ncbi:MAG TPA: HAD family hydrolase, partial [Roseimicrobium sp.]|nr:HAD family hydrolase [Roseimicrobium sp.]
MSTANSTPIKVIFVDARDTLGEVDSPGHLVPYRPSTEQFLKGLKALGVTIGVITNLPTTLPAEKGKDMVVNAELSQDPDTKKINKIGDYIARENIITNHEAGADKPSAQIFRYAADRLKVKPEECLFIGENLLENVGARLAGMAHQMKPCPPGREFQPSLVGKFGGSDVDSGRQFEAMLEHEHLLGDRIFACGAAIGKWLGELTAGKAPPLDQGKWVSPPVIDLPKPLYESISFYVHLIDHFADQVHLTAEERMIEVAVACGMDPKKGQWVLDQHDQARAYWRCLDVAWRRIQNGDSDDRFYAMIDFQKAVEAFVYLFESHAVRENAQTYPTAGQYFNDSDDALVLNIIQHSGSSDITPYIGMVERMEQRLGIKP